MVCFAIACHDGCEGLSRGTWKRSFLTAIEGPSFYGGGRLALTGLPFQSTLAYLGCLMQTLYPDGGKQIRPPQVEFAVVCSHTVDHAVLALFVRTATAQAPGVAARLQ